MPDHFKISFDEIKEICKKKKKTILKVTCICSFLACFYGVTRPIEYIAEGTFRDKAKTNNGMSSFANFISGASVNDNNAIALMNSRTMREDLAKTLNLQANLKHTRTGYLATIWQNITAEINQFLFPQHLSLQDKNPTIEVTNLTYTKEHPLTLKIKFISEEAFVILGSAKEYLLGEPIIHKDYAFTLRRVNENPIKNKLLTLQLTSLHQTAKNLFKNLIIEPDRQDKNLLNIKFKNRNRHLAAEIVNTLMEIYKNYLGTEQNLIISHQIHYLEQRQEEISRKLKNSMEHHVLKISDDIKNIGFPNTHLAMEFLTESQNNLQKKLLNIEFELKRLQNSKNALYTFYDSSNLPGDPTLINQMLTEIRQLKQQSDRLSINLQDLTDLENNDTDFQGIDLETSQSLFVSYIHKLNEIESQTLQNQFLIDQMEDENFELSSLGTILNDQISLDMSTKATLLALNLKDSNNRSLKEQDRIKEDLNLQKRFLSTHLKNANLLLILNENLMKEKVKSLQMVTYSLIQQQLSLLENTFDKYVQNRIDNLLEEAKIIEQHKLSLMHQMSSLPSKWVSEKLIELQMEVNQKMTEEISKLVETKNISGNLEVIQSTIIDKAIAPIHPKPAKTLFFAFLGGLIGFLSSSLFVLNRHFKNQK